MNPFNPQMPSVMNHDFAKVPQIGVNRSSFRSPARYLTMFDAGKLIPFHVREVIPGSTWKYDNTFLIRLNTPIVPFMDNLYADVHHFFVPCRLLWDNWKKFWGEKLTPSSSTSYTVPVVTGHADGWTVESVGDYFGIPIDKTKNVNALPFRAYNLIYNEFYRDQNIIDGVTVSTGDGPDTSSTYTIRRRGKRHDYFTSSLPAPQEGSNLTMPLGTAAPVLGIGKKTQVFGQSNVAVYDNANLTGSNPTYAIAALIDPTIGSNNGEFYVQGTHATTGYPAIYADLSQASAATIAQWRQALQLQAIAEISARGGHRYIEILYNQFQVISPDARLHRPEYLGGTTIPLYVVPVPQTSPTSGSNAQGDLAGYGTGFKQNDGFTKSFTEHGYIISIVSVRADLTYSQGLHKMWSRSTRYDFFHPMLQNIGDQAVLRQEIYLADADSSSDATVFGYQERYAEYMYTPSLITGKLRPAYSSPLDMWHLSQEFGSAPSLSQTFIEEDPPIDRVVAVTTEPDFVMDVNLDCVGVLPMSMNSIPGFLGRF